MIQKRIWGLIIAYVSITYILRAVGYVLWFGDLKLEAAAFITILSPLIAALTVCKISNKAINLTVHKFSIKGVLIGGVIPLAIFAATLILFLLTGNAVTPPY